MAFVIQTLYSDIHRIDHYPVGKYWKTNNNCNHNLHVVITHASHVCSQRSFQPPQRINGMHRMQLHRMQFDHAHFKLLPHVVTAHSVGAKFDRCRAHSLTFGYY